MMRKLVHALAIVGLAIAVQQPAAARALTLRHGYSADSTRAVTETRVPFADLDVASAAGARAMLERIDDAADAVCGGAANAVTDYQRADYRECRRVAVSGAVSRLASPALATLASLRATQLHALR